MKFKCSVIVLLLLSLLLPINMVSAEEKQKLVNGITQEVTYNNFILDLFSPEIMEAARNYYHDDGINGLAFDWNNPKYKVIEIKEYNRPNKEYKFTFMVKFNVITQKGGKDSQNDPHVFGQDTITFNVNPNLFIHGNTGKHAIKLAEYKHGNPPDKD
ncbi:DUF3888 domain-containing protein [Fictibacillus nanhaiensis]|uniref:DUF3888 domain-containing protein n=1 Tax=Fictibacillus nanhaiensis TaxID=742169 RepID=UPI002E1BABCF|nr:DUF3888 domain-containing protein [Fictibacillus nanhaiensis]